MSRTSARRGLPVRVKMRHDQHFVEELTARGPEEAVGRMLPLAQIEPDPNQPRSSMGDLAELVDSIGIRTCDAIALALRAKAPLFVHEQVFEKAQISGLTDKLGDEERLKKWLEHAGPEDLGKYEM